MPAELGTAILVDRLLNGRYHIVTHLGAGGMGRTYIAEDTGRPGNPKCVVKQLKPALPDPNLLPNARRLFNTEAEFLERLGHHEQIPRLLAYFEEEQEFYLVQEFVDGHPLSAEMPLGQRWTEPQVLQLLKDVLEILEFVHSQNAIHRDIKPENIIRRERDQRLVLIDFGAVKQVQLQQTTGVGHVSMTIGIGTPGYMPTEQSKGTPRPSSDLYALGMVAIQALTGLVPIQLQEDEEGEILWRSHAEVSDGLAAFLTCMVRYHFKYRYKTATEALQALQSLPRNPAASSNADSKSIAGFRAESGDQPDIKVIADPVVNSVTELLDGQAPEPSCSPTQVNPAVNREEPTVPEFRVSEPPPIAQMSSRGSADASEDEPDEIENLPAPSSLKHRMLFGGITLIATGLLAGGGYLLHQQVERQNQRQLLTDIEQRKNNGEYGSCLDQLAALPRIHSDIVMLAKVLESECKVAHGRQLLVEAQEAAKGSQFLQAIAIAQRISPETPSFEQTQPLITQWSESILNSAQNAYNTGEIDKATNWANNIPKSNEIYQKAQTLIQTWQQEWQQNEIGFSAAQNALNNGNWNEAIAQVDKLTHTHWKDKAKPIRARAVDETILVDADAMIQNKRCSAAIASLRRVTTDYGKQRAATLINHANTCIDQWWSPVREEGMLSASVPSQTYTQEGYEGDRFRGTVTSSDFDTVITVVDDQNQVIASNDDWNGRNSQVIFTLPRTGKYTVRVSSFGGRGRGRFNLHVERLSNYSALRLSQPQSFL